MASSQAMPSKEQPEKSRHKTKTDKNGKKKTAILDKNRGTQPFPLPWPWKWGNDATALRGFKVRSSLLHYSIWFVLIMNFSCIWHFIKLTRYSNIFFLFWKIMIFDIQNCNIAILKLIWSLIPEAPSYQLCSPLHVVVDEPAPAPLARPGVEGRPLARPGAEPRHLARPLPRPRREPTVVGPFPRPRARGLYRSRLQTSVSPWLYCCFHHLNPACLWRDLFSKCLEWLIY